MTGESTSPRRVHDLELFLEALVALGTGRSTEDEITAAIRRKARELSLRSAGMGVFSIEDDAKSLALGTIREVIRELSGFGLVVVQGGTYSLSGDGKSLASIFTRRRSSPKGLNRLSELHLRRFSNLRRLVDALGASPNGAFVIPKPYPRDFGLSIGARSLDAYEDFMAESSRFTAGEMRDWGTKGIRHDSVLAIVRRAARDKDDLYAKQGKLWTHRIMIDTIHDALSRAALAKLVPGLGVVDFEIFCSRGSTLGLLNYTDHLEGVHGRLVYATAWRVNAVPAWIRKRDLVALHGNGGGDRDLFYCHAPQWNAIRLRFERELTSAYEQLRKHKRSLAPPVADVRDSVCFRLRFSDALFNRLLTGLYHKTMQSKDGLGISLEADEIRESRGPQTTKRNPLYLSNAAPRTVIRVYRRG